MTPDLVERLRDPDLWQRDELEYIDPLAKEAAAEIERLRNLARNMHDEIQFMRNAAKENRERAETAEKQLAEARAVIEPFGRCAAPWSAYDDTENLVEPWAGDPGECPLTVGHLRAAAEWMEKIAGPDDMRAPLGARFTIDHDGFVGTVIGYYRRHDGKRGVVLQQDGTKVVHVYGEKWLKAEKNR